MFGLHVADLAVLAVYFVGIIGLGCWAAKRVHSSGDFFMPRRFGKIMMITHAFGTGTHSDQAVGVASKTFTNGLSGIWYQWLWLFCTPFYWLIAPVMRRFRAITVSDVFALRYNRSVGMLLAVVGVASLMLNTGIMLKGSGAVVSSCFGGAVEPNTVIALMTVMFLVYGMAGGLAAAIITDFVQGILTVVFSFALVPAVMQAVGGFAGLHARITDSRMFSLVAPDEIGMFYIVVIAINALVGIVTQPHIMGNCAAGRTELDGRVGFCGGNFVKRICTMAWCLTGLAAVAHLGRDVDPDHVYGIMAREFFPGIMPGLLGVFLASLLASVMSSCDSFMIASAALFTENVYRPLRPGLGEGHYVVVGRASALLIVAGGLAAAYTLPNVVAGLEMFWKVAAMMGVSFWLGLFWRRMTSAGAWASTLAGFGVWYLSTRPEFVDMLAGCSVCWGLRFTIEKDGIAAMYMPWQMIFYLAAATGSGIVVSLVTPRCDAAKLERFYALVRTPVGTGEPDPPAPCELPEGVVVPEKSLLIAKGGLEILRPSMLSVVGFAVSWLLVVVMVYGFYLMTR